MIEVGLSFVWSNAIVLGILSLGFLVFAILGFRHMIKNRNFQSKMSLRDYLVNILLVLGLLAITSPMLLLPFAVFNKDSSLYEVSRADMISSIESKYDVSVDSIEWNSRNSYLAKLEYDGDSLRCEVVRQDDSTTVFDLYCQEPSTDLPLRN